MRHDCYPRPAGGGKSCPIRFKRCPGSSMAAQLTWIDEKRSVFMELEPQSVDQIVLVLSNAPDELTAKRIAHRSEEHTSELQSRGHLVCRLLLENKNQADGGGQ